MYPRFAALAVVAALLAAPAAAAPAAAKRPAGMAYYQMQVAEMTTTTMSAQEIHELGKREVARIDEWIAHEKGRA